MLGYFCLKPYFLRGLINIWLIADIFLLVGLFAYLAFRDKSDETVVNQPHRGRLMGQSEGNPYALFNETETPEEGGVVDFIV